MHIFRISPAILVVLLAGCAATGPQYSTAASDSKKLNENQGRIVVFRGDELMLAPRSAGITLDGAKVGECDRSGFNTFDVAAGHHKLMVDLWDVPGTCEVEFELGPKEVLHFRVEPRSESVMAGVLGGIIGSAIEGAGAHCDGAFRIRWIESENAKQLLAGLKKTQ